MHVVRLNIEREGKHPLRVVENFNEVRSYLNSNLDEAEKQLGVSRRIRLMPYVMVIGSGSEQRILPIGIERDFYDVIKRNVVRELRDSNQTLYEFGLEKTGLLVGKGSLRGKISLLEEAELEQKLRETDLIAVPVYREPYGLFTSDQEPYQMHSTNAYLSLGWERGFPPGPSDEKLKRNIRCEEASIVTLGPPDNIVEIVQGKQRFSLQPTWGNHP
ncbi:hypothetical protein HYX00_05430 [Candidatus Woesearchaeota archaeon]|nr:hypothetical protein [Candidatus Woesearchaeota archaeon]